MPLDTAGELARIDKQQAGVDTQQTALTADMAKSATGREAATTPLLQDVSKTQGQQADYLQQRQAGTPQIPEFKEQPPISAKEYEGFSYALIGMAMIGGVASRGNWLGASAALNGSMKGFIEGNHDLAEKNYKDYNEKFKTAVAKENQYVKETDAVLKSKDLSINQKLTQVRIIAAQYDKQDMLAMSRMKSLDGIRKSIESQRTSVLRIQEMHDSNLARIEDSRARRAEVREMALMRIKMQNPESNDLSKDDTTRRFMAEQYWAGDKSVMQNLGRGVQGSKNIMELRREIERIGKETGRTPKDLAMAMAEFQGLTAGERTLGTRQAQIEMAGTVLTQFVPIAKAASAAYTRSGIKSVNDLQKAIQSRTASPELRKLDASVNAVINAYGRAINPSGVGNEADKVEARKILDTAFSSGDFDAAADQLMLEIGAELKAPGKVKAGMREFFTGRSAEGSTTGGVAPPPAGFKVVE